MSKLQNSNSLLPFIDYIPAELKENKVWKIVYHALDPYETKEHKRLKRKRHRVRYFKCKKTRRIYAQSIIIKLNEQLMRGWTPFNRVNNSPKQEQKLLKKVKLFDVFDNYLHQINQQTAKKSLRPDTLRAYTSYIKNLKVFLTEKNKQIAKYLNSRFNRS